jgi:hypothetical protein
VFTPVLAKHSKNFSLQDSLAIGVDRMQRNFEPMRQRWNLRSAHPIVSISAYPAMVERLRECKRRPRRSCIGAIQEYFLLHGLGRLAWQVNFREEPWRENERTARRK